MPNADAFRRRVLPLLLMLGLVAIAGWVLFRASRGLPDQANPSKGDFEHFYYAARAMASGRDIHASHTGGYIYPPLLAALLIPLASLELRTAQMVWAGLNLAMVAAIVWAALRVVSDRWAVPRERLTWSAVALVGVLLTFEPLRQEIEEGQSDTLIALGFMLALLTLDRRPWLAGACIGLACNIKYQALIAVPYLMLRRRWAAAASSLLSAVVFALLPAVITGWHTNLQQLSVAFRGVGKLFGFEVPGGAVRTHDIRWEKSISIPSGIAKTLGESASTMLIGAIVLAIAAATLVAAWAIFRRRGVPLFRGRSAKADARGLLRGVVPLEWAGLLVAVLALSPQTTVRHTFILLGLNVFAAAVLIVPRAGVTRWPLVAGLALAIAGSLLPPGNVESLLPALNAWRSIGGTSWCLLLMYLALLWVGLEYARAAAERRPLLDPPPGWRDPAS